MRTCLPCRLRYGRGLVLNHLAASQTLLCVPDYLMHFPMHSSVVSRLEPPHKLTAHKGREASKKMLNDFRASFPDLKFWGVGPLIAENTPEGDFVVGRYVELRDVR